MTKKIWFYLSVIQTIILVGIIAVSMWSSLSVPKYKNTDLKKYLEEHKYVNYLPAAGYIPDAKTAKIVGSQIIDRMTGNSGFVISEINIEYDEENRLWLVSKSYLFKNGGIIVIQQDSGEIIKAFLVR